MNITIYIVEDHQLVSDAWMSLLKQIKDFTIVGRTDNAEDALRDIIELVPDIVLMDINIVGGSGIEVTSKISELLLRTRVIGLSIHDDIAFVKYFFLNGASGYLSKNTSKKELELAIREVYRGETFVSKDIKDKQFFNTIDSDTELPQKELTIKEIEIIKLIAQGFKYQEIADKLSISKRTVDAHRSNILKKLNVPNAAQLSTYAKNKGYT